VDVEPVDGAGGGLVAQALEGGTDEGAPTPTPQRPT
jgi:hypothetical protein